MDKFDFTKMVASGNDFVLVNPSTSQPFHQLKRLAKNICNRKYGIGADGLLILEKSKVADIKMRIFNPDGSEANMCGNGARCVALYAGRLTSNILTKAGIINCKVNKDNVKIRLTNPCDLKLDIPIKIDNRIIKVNFINTGVPHTVIFVEGLDKIDVVKLGRQIRWHHKFKPQGANVDFVEVLNNNSIKIRTYERGVEDETLACGTGAVASALIFVYRLSSIVYRNKINIYTKSGEILNVYFKKEDNDFSDIWLEGKVKLVYKGVYYV